MAEAMRHAFVDRNFLLGDPAFVTNPLDRLSELMRQKFAPRSIRGRRRHRSDVQPGIAPHGD
jgi:gamma-glutamyltranspeptidase/glutathione hydrolase